MFILQQKINGIKKKREDITKQGFCKILRIKVSFRGSLLLVLTQFLGGWEGRRGLGICAYLSFSGREEGGVGISAYSRLGDY